MAESTDKVNIKATANLAPKSVLEEQAFGSLFNPLASNSVSTTASALASLSLMREFGEKTDAELKSLSDDMGKVEVQTLKLSMKMLKNSPELRRQFGYSIDAANALAPAVRQYIDKKVMEDAFKNTIGEDVEEIVKEELKREATSKQSRGGYRVE